MSTQFATYLFEEEQLRQVVDRARELLTNKYEDFDEKLSAYDTPTDTVADALNFALSEAEARRITDILLLNTLLEWVAIDVFCRMYVGDGRQQKPFSRAELFPYFTILEELEKILKEIFTGRR